MTAISKLSQLEQKATKGPFVANIYDVNEPDEGDERTNPNVILHASVSLGNSRCAIFGSWHDEARYAAALMSAAPSLLAYVLVLEVDREWLLSRLGDHDRRDMSGIALRAATDLARQALEEGVKGARE